MPNERIPPELGNLLGLEELLLLENALSGPIPPESDKLANLTMLVFNFNQLAGQFRRNFDSTLTWNHGPLDQPLDRMRTRSLATSKAQRL